jgi:hypothetical protein
LRFTDGRGGFAAANALAPLRGDRAEPLVADVQSRTHRHLGRQWFPRREGRARQRRDGTFATGTSEDLCLAARSGVAIYPSSPTTATRFGPEIRHLDSPHHAHFIGETIPSIADNRARGAASLRHPDVARFHTPIRYDKYDT